MAEKFTGAAADPAEGSREVIEKDLARQSGKNAEEGKPRSDRSGAGDASPANSAGKGDSKDKQG